MTALYFTLKQWVTSIVTVLVLIATMILMIPCFVLAWALGVKFAIYHGSKRVSTLRWFRVTPIDKSK
jgi:hypothetical protein